MGRIQQGAIHDQGLRISHQFGHDGAPQGFEQSPEAAHAAVKRGGVKADDPREEVGEEAGGLAQEGVFGFHPPKLLEDGEDLRVREPLEGGVEIPARIEDSVGVADLARQGGDRFFQERSLWGTLCLGHPVLLWSRHYGWLSF
jgi:hypothetical protein